MMHQWVSEWREGLMHSRAHRVARSLAEFVTRFTTTGFERCESWRRMASTVRVTRATLPIHRKGC